MVNEKAVLFYLFLRDKRRLHWIILCIIVLALQVKYILYATHIAVPRILKRNNYRKNGLTYE